MSVDTLVPWALAAGSALLPCMIIDYSITWWTMMRRAVADRRVGERRIVLYKLQNMSYDGEAVVLLSLLHDCLSSCIIPIAHGSICVMAGQPPTQGAVTTYMCACV